MLIFMCAVVIFFIGYILIELIDVKRRVTRLTQENAILWQIVREHEDI